MQTGRTERPGNRAVADVENEAVEHAIGRSGSAGNRKAFIPYRGEPRAMYQENGGCGRSARPGDRSPGFIPSNPSHGMGKGTVSSAGIPPKQDGKFEQAGVKY